MVQDRAIVTIADQ